MKLLCVGIDKGEEKKNGVHADRAADGKAKTKS